MKQKIFNYLMSKQWFINLVRQRLNDELEYVQFNHHAEGCGLEDRNIQDRYEAMEHGWDRCFEAVEEAIENVA